MKAYFSDLSGQAAGIYLRRQIRLSLSGSILRLAEDHPRGTSSLDVRTKIFYYIYRKSRPSREFWCVSFTCGYISCPARYRAMTALWLLSPGTPMFFQGQEYGAETPFYYFADFDGDLAQSVQQRSREVHASVRQSGYA